MSDQCQRRGSANRRENSPPDCFLTLLILPRSGPRQCRCEPKVRAAKIADRIGLEPLLRDHVARDLWQARDALAIGLEPMAPQWLTVADKSAATSGSDAGSLAIGIEPMADNGSTCNEYRQSSNGSSVCLRKATMIASASGVSPVDFGSLGPVGKSATPARLRHLVTVFWLIP